MFFAVGWLLVFFVHLNTFKRASLASTKDTLIEEIYGLIELYDEEEKLFNEQAFEHKTIRIERKIEELNSIYHGKVFSLSDRPISNVITFDIEEKNAKEKIAVVCFDAVEFIDSNYHKCIQTRSSIFYINRYEFAGVFFASTSLYTLAKLFTWLFTSDI